MKKALAIFALLAALALTFALSSANTPTNGFSVEFSSSAGRAGDRTELYLDYDGTIGDISALLFTVTYDPAAFRFLGLTQATPAEHIYSTTYDNNGVLKSVFVLSSSITLAKGRVLTARFQTVGEEAWNANFFVDVEQVAFAQGGSGEDWHDVLDYRIDPAPSGEAALLWLNPSAGQLSPAFSPDTLEYWLTVPYEIVEMKFDGQAAEGGSFRVNRKKLGGGGSDTRFAITVTAEDGKTKQVYEVMVRREEKPAPLPTISPTPKPTRTPKPTATPKPTKTPKPTATPKPTNTPKPTATPKPTNTPKPTATPKPTNTPKPTATPKPTKTPKPTATPKPSNTPKPTATPKPSNTPKPTATPKPSKTPKPTATPKPSKTPKPTETPVPSAAGGIEPSSSPRQGIQLIVEEDGPTWEETTVIVGVLGSIVACAALFVGYYWGLKMKNQPGKGEDGDSKEGGELEDDYDDDDDDTTWLLR